MARLMVAASFLLLAALAGCSDDGGAAKVEVGIHGFAFDPATLNVDAGSTVVFTNHESSVHTATADDGSFDSGDLDEGESYEVHLDPGTYRYHCTRHTSMRGTLVVA